MECEWFLEIWPLHPMSPWSCPWADFWSLKYVSSWLWPQSRGPLNYAVSFFGLKPLRGWTFYFSIALKFIFKTQNPSVMDLRYEEFLSCPWGTLLIRIGKSCCSSQSKQWSSIWARHSNTGSVKKVSRSTIAFWLRVVIIEAYRVASDGDYTVVRLSHTRSTILTLLCCSGNTFQSASNEGWNVSITDHINQIILKGCLSQVNR